MLHILHIEDCVTDAYLIEQTIARHGIEAHLTVVRDQSEFISALNQKQYDVVLADSGVPGFSGFKAMKLVQEKCPGVSYICVSGVDDPRHIQKSLDAGAIHYVPKNDLSRLVVALREEQEKVQSRQK